ncbi:MAG: hypothetical protein H0U57_05640, partial [Tatlockia sp.]|nr:hypothetical protein [Tatlockia sp.]
KGHLTGEEARFSGGNITMDGIDLNKSFIQSKNKLEVKNAKTLDSGLSAETMHLQDSSFKATLPLLDEESKAPSDENTPEATTPEGTEAAGANQIKAAGQLTTNNVVMEGMQISSTLHDDYKGTYKKSHASAKTFKGKDSQFEKCSYRSKDIDLSGETKVNASQLYAENKLTQKGHLTGEEALFSGGNITMDGIDLNKSFIQSKNKLEVKNAKTLDSGLSAETMHLQDSSFKATLPLIDEESKPSDENTPEPTTTEATEEASANQIKAAGQLITNNVVMEGMQISSTLHDDYKGTYKKTHASAKTFKGKDSQFEKCSYRSKDMYLTGETKVKASQLYAKNKLTQKGHLTGKEAHFSGGNITMDGIDLNKSFIQSKNKLEVKNAKTLDSGLSAQTMHLQDSTFKATLPKIEDESKTPSGEKTPDPTSTEATEEAGSNQIKAAKTITTNNVVFEGQSINADKMTLNKSKMKSSHAKINKTFRSEDNVINKSTVESNKATFTGNNSLAETLVKAKESIIFEKKGHLKTHDCEFDGGNKIEHRSANHKQTGNLLFKAKDVQTTATTRLYSGKGKNNAFYVQSETGNFQGAMNLDNGHFDVKKLNNAHDLIGKKGQSKNQNFSKSLSINIDDAVNLEHMEPRDCNISIRAKSIEVKTDYKSAHDVTLIASKGNVAINGN